MTEMSESQDEADWYKYGNSDLDLLNNFYGQSKILPIRDGMSPCKYLEDLKVLANNVIIRNGNFLSGEDFEILKQKYAVYTVLYTA